MEKSLKPIRGNGFYNWKSKGGYIANVEGLACFMPSSQIDVRPLERLTI